MSANKTIWYWIIGVVVVAAIAVWWVMAQEPIAMPFISAASTTSAGAASTSESASAPSGYPVQKTARDVVSIVNGLSNGTQFASLLRSSGVGAAIKTGASNHYTIFVPTNAAFSQLPRGTISTMTGAQLKRLVQYHIVANRAIDVSAESTGTIEALSGDPLNFSLSASKIPMVGSAIVAGEYQGTNGIVYLISGVLLPPQKTR